MGRSPNPYVTVYERLLKAYGPQGWWPGDTPFEVMVGSVLTQNTAWSNVERAIDNLKASGRFGPTELWDMPDGEVALRIRPSGYYNVKTRRLKALLEYFVTRYGGDIDRMKSVPTDILESELLEVSGVGPETADSILLYALGRPCFVVDAYTRRIFGRLGLVNGDVTYRDLQRTFVAALPEDPNIYNEYHALIVVLGKDVCRPVPKCGECPLASMCAAGGGSIGPARGRRPASN
jgi:endonuclease-3 related protein